MREIRILKFFCLKKFVKLKWDLHCLARMSTNFHEFFSLFVTFSECLKLVGTPGTYFCTTWRILPWPVWSYCLQPQNLSWYTLWFRKPLVLVWSRTTNQLPLSQVVVCLLGTFEGRYWKRPSFLAFMHGVGKSQKKSRSTMRAKRATFTFWVDKS